jgi:hypothetical protein
MVCIKMGIGKTAIIYLTQIALVSIGNLKKTVTYNCDN